MKDKQTYSFELETAMHEFLEQMAAQYKLGDAGKAARCLINYARDNADQHDAIFDEIRCLDC